MTGFCIKCNTGIKLVLKPTNFKMNIKILITTTTKSPTMQLMNMKKAKWSFRELNTDLKSLNEMRCGNDS